jgi:hypothetical protein
MPRTVIMATLLFFGVMGSASAQQGSGAPPATQAPSYDDLPPIVGEADDDKTSFTLTKDGASKPESQSGSSPSGKKVANRSLPKHVVTRYVMRVGPDGAGCLDTVRTRRDTPMTGREIAENDEVWLFANRLRLAACPDEEGATRVITPAEVAEPFVRTIPLPAPRPRIPPGHAITGLPAYLETRGSLTHRVGPAPTALGPIEVHATGAYYVDWGDGSPEEGPFAFEGEPYPTGRIAHTYRDTGTYTVTVREAWSADWRLGGDSGTVPGLQTEASIPLEVRQLQAVRIR